MKKFPCEFLGSFLGFLLICHPCRASAQTTTEDKQASPAVASASPPIFTLEDGTPVKLGVCWGLTSAKASVGDTIDFEVKEEVTVRGILVIPRGGHAWGSISGLQLPRSMGRAARLSIAVDSVRLVTGEKAPLRTVKEFRGLNAAATVALRTAIVPLATIYFPIFLPMALLENGEHMVVPPGKDVTAFVNGNLPLDKGKFPDTNAPANVSLPHPLSPQRVSGETLSINSEPHCADVEIDGSLAGLTPYRTASFVPGVHVIRISKTGYAPFEIKLQTSSSISEIRTTLEPEAKP